MSKAITARADQDAARLADEMLDADETMKTIIGETLDAAEDGIPMESGRTVCPRPGEILMPHSRFPQAVELAMCPVGTSGTWHTHVTRDQLRNPVNSLPDISNVVFGGADVSVVAGTQSAHAVVAAADREAAQDVFQNATGLDVSGAAEVAEAVMDGRVDPVEARQRVLSKLDGMMVREQTGYTDLDARVESEVSTDAPPMEEQDAFRFMQAAERQLGLSGAAAEMCDNMDMAGQRMSRIIPGDELKGQLVSTTSGIIIGRVVERVLFGD